MVTVKMLQPYYIKTRLSTLSVVLAYQYFSVFINGSVYQFIPVETSEIRINLHTKKIENIEARFAFQKGKDIIYMTMMELLTLSDFQKHVHDICEPYYETASKSEKTILNVISELEQMNVRRLIDKALDEKDVHSFKKLVQQLEKNRS